MLYPKKNPLPIFYIYILRKSSRLLSKLTSFLLFSALTVQQQIENYKWVSILFFTPSPAKEKSELLGGGHSRGSKFKRDSLSSLIPEGPSGPQPHARPLCLSSVSMGPHVQTEEYNGPVKTHLFTMPLIREKFLFLNSPFILIL